jgi:hypothetical protein
MFVLYKHQSLGTYHTAEVESREQAAQYEPYMWFVTANEAHVLSNHLNGHTLWTKASCTVCRPAIVPKPPTSSALTDYELSLRDAEEKKKASAEAAQRRLMQHGRDNKNDDDGGDDPGAVSMRLPEDRLPVDSVSHSRTGERDVPFAGEEMVEGPSEPSNEDLQATRTEPAGEAEAEP